MGQETRRTGVKTKDISRETKNGDRGQRQRRVTQRKRTTEDDNER